MKSYNELQEEKKGFTGTYFKIECPVCHELYVYSHYYDNITANTVLYKPEEMEFDGHLFKDGKVIPYKDKRIVSSDYMKDLITLTCPICGEKHVYTRKELIDASKKCNYFGDETTFFELSCKSKELADEFRKNHSHKDNFEKEGKLGFSTLGQQFSYIFTPGGLGCDIEIRCNQCGETKRITDDTNW